MGAERVEMIFKAIDVWRRVDAETVKRYRCFEILPNKGYCVQSADFYTLPTDRNKVEAFDRQFLELLGEQSPDERNSTYQTLEEAIEQHERDFEESTE